MTSTVGYGRGKRVLLHNDGPAHKERDRFGRYELATQIAQGIYGQLLVDSLVVGIYGPWGSGKTTMLKWITEHVVELSGPKRQARQEESGAFRVPSSWVVYRFEPWLVSDPDDLLRVFFRGINIALERDAKHDAKQLKKAIDELATAAGLISASLSLFEPVTALLFRLLSLLGLKKYRTLSRTSGKREPPDFDALRASLRKTGLRVVVTIDDLDRLDPEPLTNMLRLLHALSRFPNFVFLVAADDEVVGETLSGKLGEFGRTFLGKLVHIPYALPDFGGDGLKGMLRELLIDRVLARSGEVTTQEGILERRFDHFWEHGFSKILGSPRDIERVTASTSLKWFGAVAEHADLLSLVLLEALRIESPSVHRTLAKARNELVCYPPAIGLPEPPRCTSKTQNLLTHLEKEHMGATCAANVCFPSMLKDESMYEDWERYDMEGSPTNPMAWWLYFDPAPPSDSLTFEVLSVLEAYLEEGDDLRAVELFGELQERDRLLFLNTHTSNSDDPDALWALLLSECRALAGEWVENKGFGPLHHGRWSAVEGLVSTLDRSGRAVVDPMFLLVSMAYEAPSVDFAQDANPQDWIVAAYVFDHALRGLEGTLITTFETWRHTTKWLRTQALFVALASKYAIQVVQVTELGAGQLEERAFEVLADVQMPDALDRLLRSSAKQWSNLRRQATKRSSVARSE